MLTKLNKCPFCGSTDVEVEDDWAGYYTRDCCYVECGECESRGPSIYYGYDYEDSHRKAIMAWNKRGPRK